MKLRPTINIKAKGKRCWDCDFRGCARCILFGFKLNLDKELYPLRCKQCLDAELHIDKCCVCKKKIIRHENDLLTWNERMDFDGTVCEGCGKALCYDCSYSAEDADLCQNCYHQLKVREQ